MSFLTGRLQTGICLLPLLVPGWLCRNTYTCTRLIIQRFPQRTTHTLKDYIHTPRLADRDTPTDVWWDRHEDTVDLTPWLSTQEVGGKARQRDAAEIKEEMGFLYRKVERGGVASPNLTDLRGWVVFCRGEVRWVSAGGGLRGIGRREDSPRLRVFLSNNNVICIIHPRIPVTEESLSVNRGAKPEST